MGRPRNRAPQTPLERLARENARLQAELALLKKLRTLAQARAPRRQRAEAIQALRSEHGLGLLLELAGMARSTFYHQLKRPAPGGADALRDAVARVHAQHRGRYGYRRITAQLQAEGLAVNAKAVRARMRALGLAGHCPPRKRRRPAGVIVHSDQGCLYQHRDYRDLLKWHGAVQSMSRRGNCWDNACAESLFARMKIELLRAQEWGSLAAFERALARYVEYYNRDQRRLGGESPARRRAQYELKNSIKQS